MAVVAVDPDGGHGLPRSAIVTGAGTAIGRAVVERFAVAGTRVVAVDASETALAWTLGREGVVALVADAGAGEGAARMVALAAERHGPPEAVVLLLGEERVGPLTDAPSRAIDGAISGPLRTAFLGTRAAHAAMRASGGGAIALVPLGAGDGTSCTGIVHAAVANLMRGFAVELCRDGVRINVAVPELAAIGTGRPVAPAEVAEVVAFLCSSDAGWVDGVVLPVDGGLGVGVGVDSGTVRHG